MKQQIIEARHQMEIFAGTLDGLSPAKKLMQGYSVAVNDAGRNIRSTKDVQPGEDIVDPGNGWSGTCKSDRHKGADKDGRRTDIRGVFFRTRKKCIEKMQDTEVSLEDSFALYEQGMKMLKNCNQKIDAVEKKMLKMNEQWRIGGVLRGTMDRKKEVEQIVTSFLPKEEGYQKTVLEAMNYSVSAGGKRLRPMLMLETYRMFGGTSKVIEPFMAAIEMIHTYSLIHDDLPAMDNDEYRRGRKTTHVVYGEAMAILAGDALLNYAFETAASAFVLDEGNPAIGKAFMILASKAGVYGMIGGQVVDVESEGKEIDADTLKFIHIHKTSSTLRIRNADRSGVSRCK